MVMFTQLILSDARCSLSLSLGSESLVFLLLSIFFLSQESVRKHQVCVLKRDYYKEKKLALHDNQSGSDISSYVRM